MYIHGMIQEDHSMTVITIGVILLDVLKKEISFEMMAILPMRHAATAKDLPLFHLRLQPVLFHLLHLQSPLSNQALRHLQCDLANHL